MSNIQAQQADFMIAGDQEIVSLGNTLRRHNPHPQVKLYVNLTLAEMKELTDAFELFDKADMPDIRLAAIAEIADGVADTIVTLMGLCNSIGIPFQAVYDEVHRSNMLKCVKQNNGQYKVLKRADGKIIKPNDWRAPDIMSVLKYKLISEN